MARRPGLPAARAESKKPKTPTPSEPFPPSRSDELVKLLEHCSAAQVAANALDETFLTYLLAMAVEEVRAILQRTTPVIKKID